MVSGVYLHLIQTTQTHCPRLWGELWGVWLALKIKYGFSDSYVSLQRATSKQRKQPSLPRVEEMANNVSQMVRLCSSVQRSILFTQTDMHCRLKVTIWMWSPLWSRFCLHVQPLWSFIIRIFIAALHRASFTQSVSERAFCVQCSLQVTQTYTYLRLS